MIALVYGGFGLALGLYVGWRLWGVTYVRKI